jgi:hypothetical protein
VSTDSTVFNATTLQYTGHVYGRAGQGAATVPADNHAFFPDPSILPANRVTSLMISVFPNDGTQPALNSQQNIVVNLRSVSWNDGTYPLDAPAQPQAPMMPEAGLGAKMIVATLTGAATVAMTLF